jgi:hypothetical protein
MKDTENAIAAKFLSFIRRWGYERAFRVELDVCFAHCETPEQKRQTYLWLVRHAALQVRDKVKEDRRRFPRRTR